MIPAFLTWSGIPLISDPEMPEFAPLSFKQKSAAWYGRPVKRNWCVCLLDGNAYMHPNVFAAVCKAIPVREGGA